MKECCIVVVFFVCNFAASIRNKGVLIDATYPYGQKRRWMNLTQNNMKSKDFNETIQGVASVVLTKCAKQLSSSSRCTMKLFCILILFFSCKFATSIVTKM